MPMGIRDVVGHLVSEITLPVAKLMGGMVKSRFRINKFIAGDACRKGDVLTNNWSMLSGLWCRRAGTILGLSSMLMLKGIVIHAFDIRNPVHRPRSSGRSHGPRRFGLVVQSGPVGHKLFSDLRVTASDVEWSCGHGNEVNRAIEGSFLP